MTKQQFEFPALNYMRVKGKGLNGKAQFEFPAKISLRVMANYNLNSPPKFVGE